MYMYRANKDCVRIQGKALRNHQDLFIFYRRFTILEVSRYESLDHTNIDLQTFQNGIGIAE